MMTWRDYLMTVPSQVDLLGKTALSDAFETMPEKALNCVCYMAYGVEIAGNRWAASKT